MYKNLQFATSGLGDPKDQFQENWHKISFIELRSNILFFTSDAQNLTKPENLLKMEKKNPNAVIQNLTSTLKSLHQR